MSPAQKPLPRRCARRSRLRGSLEWSAHTRRRQSALSLRRTIPRRFLEEGLKRRHACLALDDFVHGGPTFQIERKRKRAPIDLLGKARRREGLALPHQRFGELAIAHSRTVYQCAQLSRSVLFPEVLHVVFGGLNFVVPQNKFAAIDRFGHHHALIRLFRKI